jgi:Subtilase family/Secretion system C-terminal sorting domain
MKQKILFSVVILFTTLIAWTQPNNYYYYYRTQQSPVTLSEKDMYVKFLPNLTNTQKLAAINQAQVDIIGSDPNSLPDVVRLRSRILQKLVWVFPCGNPSAEARVKFSKKELQDAIFQKPAPCEGCPPPPPCTTPPYQIWQSYDNFFEALFFFGDHNNVRSSSKAIIRPNGEAVGTCEDFYIKLKPAFSITDLGALITYYSLTATDVSSSMGTGIYRIDETRGGSRFCLERANIFFQTGKCEISHPNFYMNNSISTVDPEYGNQWSLLNTGQHSGIVGADIRIEQAWQITKGDPNIKIAVLDNGVQLNHPDLQANLLPGFDAIGGGTAGGATGAASHGTNCAGIIGAIADNNIGIAGIAPNCKILPVRISEGNNINIAAATAGLNWAVDNGASVISNSWGGIRELASDLFEIAVNRATTIGRGGKGCLLFFATGNEDVGVSWPAILPNVMSVGAINMFNQRKSFTSSDNEQWGSNYGERVDYVAPSPKITTLTINSGVRNDFRGTSAATPHAAGIAALLLSVNPNLTLAEARKLLDYSCNKVGAYCYDWTTAQPNRPNSGWNEQTGYGRLNAYNAVQLARPGVTISNPTYNVAAQSNSQVTGNIGVVFGGLSCPATIPFGIYFFRRYEVLANITYPTTINPIIVCSSNGISQANPSAGQRWAEAINVTNTSATLRTFVYIGYSSNGANLGWVPRDPSTINFTFSVISSPTPINYQLQRSGNNSGSQFVNSSIPFKLDLNNVIKTADIPVETTTNGIVSNPVNGSVKINLEIEKNETVFMQILSSNGVVIKTQERKIVQKGITRFEIDTKDLISGVYLLKVSTQRSSKVYKFIKQ